MKPEKRFWSANRNAQLWQTPGELQAPGTAAQPPWWSERSHQLLPTSNLALYQVLYMSMQAATFARNMSGLISIPYFTLS